MVFWFEILGDELDERYFLYGLDHDGSWKHVTGGNWVLQMSTFFCHNMILFCSLCSSCSLLPSFNPSLHCIRTRIIVLCQPLGYSLSMRFDIISPLNHLEFEVLGLSGRVWYFNGYFWEGDGTIVFLMSLVVLEKSL